MVFGGAAQGDGLAAGEDRSLEQRREGTCPWVRVKRPWDAANLQGTALSAYRNELACNPVHSHGSVGVEDDGCPACDQQHICVTRRPLDGAAEQRQLPLWGIVLE